MSQFTNAFERRGVAVEKALDPPAPFYGRRFVSNLTVDEEPSKLAGFSASLRLHWRLLALLALVGALAGGAYFVARPPIYRARTLIEVQQPNVNFLNRGDLDQASNLVGEEKNQYLQTKVRSLESDSLLLAAAVILRESTAEPRPEWMNWKIARDGSPEQKDKILRSIRKVLTIHLLEETRLIELAFESSDPRLSADFVNTMAQEFVRLEAENYVRSAVETTRALGPQLSEIKRRLENSEGRLRSYAEGAGLLVTSTNENLGDQRVKQSQQELESARSQRIAQQARYEALATAPKDSVPELLVDTGIKDLQTRISQQRQQLADLLTIYSPSHYEVKRVQAQVQELERAYREHRENMANQIGVAYDVAQRREALALTAYNAAAADLSGQSSRTIQYDILKREVDLDRQLYDSTFRKISDGGVLAAVRPNNVRIVDAAFPPTIPNEPRLVASLTAGLLLGLLSGIAGVLVHERPGERFHKSADTTEFLGIPQLGAIPRCPATLSAGNLLADSSTSDRRGWSPTQSMFAESCVAVVSSILFNLGEIGGSRTLAVVSPGRGDGKTTTTVSLGVAFANRGLRTLLIDGDLRNPQLHDAFYLPNDSGLLQFLRNDVWHMAPFSVPVANLFVLPSGGVCDAPAGLLNSERMAILMQKLQATYDVILIDTPPARVFADARLWSSVANGVVLVVRSGRTSRDDAKVVRQRLAEDGSTVIGAVLNDWNPEREGGGSKVSDYTKAARA